MTYKMNVWLGAALYVGLLTLTNGEWWNTDDRYLSRMSTAFKFINGNPEVALFARILKTAGVYGLYKGGKNTYVVPSNAAFYSLNHKEMKHIVKNPQILKELVESHVVYGPRYTPADFDEPYLTALNKEKISVIVNKAYPYDVEDFGGAVTLNDARVTSVKRVHNGVVLIVDRVIFPRRIYNLMFDH